MGVASDSPGHAITALVSPLAPLERPRQNSSLTCWPRPNRQPPLSFGSGRRRPYPEAFLQEGILNWHGFPSVQNDPTRIRTKFRRFFNTVEGSKIVAHF